jgi:hypothetical protein
MRILICENKVLRRILDPKERDNSKRWRKFENFIILPFAEYQFGPSNQ